MRSVVAMAEPDIARWIIWVAIVVALGVIFLWLWWGERERDLILVNTEKAWCEPGQTIVGQDGRLYRVTQIVHLDTNVHVVRGRPTGERA